MVTKVNSRCYRFVCVDFEPENRLLYWQDQAITPLSYEESCLLEMLCYHAGQVLSEHALYTSTSSPDTTFIQHKNNLCSLLSKSYREGEKMLPIHVIGNYGYRVDLPQKTYQRSASSFPDPDKPDPLEIVIDGTEHFTVPGKPKNSRMAFVICIILSLLVFFVFLLG